LLRLCSCAPLSAFSSKILRVARWDFFPATPSAFNSRIFVLRVAESLSACIWTSLFCCGDIEAFSISAVTFDAIATFYHNVRLQTEIDFTDRHLLTDVRLSVGPLKCSLRLSRSERHRPCSTDAGICSVRVSLSDFHAVVTGQAEVMTSKTGWRRTIA